MNPLVFCPCTLWPQFGTVTSVPLRQRIAEPLRSVRRQDARVRAAHQQHRQVECARILQRDVLLRPAAAHDAQPARIRIALADELAVRPLQHVVFHGALDVLARAVRIVLLHVAHEVLQVVELLVVAHEAGDHRAAAIRHLGTDIDDHQRAQQRRIAPRQQHRIAPAHRVAHQDRAARSPSAAMNASASSDIS